MDSRWSDSEAKSFVDRYARDGIASDLALRVYTTRLLGQDPRLVLHGGGNTSVKTRVTDLVGDEVDVLCVKGSGWDMAQIEPAGLPAVRLSALRKLRARDSLSDEDMVRIQRANLIDPMAPNPSVEALLHAFLPHTFVDHTHSTAVLSLIDQPNGVELCEEVYDGRMGVVPYIMPGFGLAKKSAEIFEADPKVEGLILLKHGVFTFGADARESYERMIAMVSLAETRLARGRKAVFASAQLPQRVAGPRRSCADRAGRMQPERHEDRGRVAASHPRLSCQRRHPEFRQRPGRSALQPSRRRHAGPHHSHEELAAGAARSGRRKGG